MAHVPVYSDIVLHFPSRLAFRALTSKSYFTRELRPHSLVRSMHITGAFNVSLVKLSSLLFPDGLKRTSYAVTSFAVLHCLVYPSSGSVKVFLCPGLTSGSGLALEPDLCSRHITTIECQPAIIM